MCDSRISLEKAKQAAERAVEQVATERVEEMIAASHNGRLCVDNCPPATRIACHANGITPAQCTEPKQ